MESRKRTASIIPFSVSGSVESAQKMIESGVEVNHLDRGGKSPLLLSVEKGYLEMIIMLLEHEAQVNLCDAVHPI